MFSDLGHQMVQQSTHSLMQQGLGALGKRFGIGLGDTGKPSGTAGNPLYVRMVDGIKGIGSGLSGLFRKGGSDNSDSDDAGIFGHLLARGDSGGSSMGNSIMDGLKAFAATGYADGGYPSPSDGYSIVGENGIELMDNTSRRVMNNYDARRVLDGAASGGDVHNHYTIDARGTDPALTAARTRQAVAQAQREAVRQGAHAAHEQSLRRPRKK
jgi:hypothetical protein